MHKNKKQTIKKRHKRNFDKDKLLEELLDGGNLLLELLNEKDSESATQHFLKKILDSLNSHQPMRELSKREKKTSRQTMANIWSSKSNKQKKGFIQTI